MPRASTIGVRPTTQSHRPLNKPSNQFVNLNNDTAKTENKLSKSFVLSDSQKIGLHSEVYSKKCYKCGSPSHLVSACPQRGDIKKTGFPSNANFTSKTFTNSRTGPVRTNRCVVTSAVESQPVNVDPCEVGQSLSKTVNSVTLDVPIVATPGGGKTKVSVCNATLLLIIISFYSYSKYNQTQHINFSRERKTNRGA